MLILARALMGIGGACIYPSTLSILTNTFHDVRERARAIGIWAGVSGLGVAIGPLAGGLLVEHFWWGSVFLVNVPICAAAIILGRFFVPTTTRDSDHALDPLGAVFSIIGLMGLLFAIIEVPDRGLLGPHRRSSPSGWASSSWAPSRGGRRTTRHPMLDLHFFQNPRFSAASATITLTFFALYGSTFLLTQYFQFVLGYSPFKAGLLTAPVAIGIMVTAPQAPKLVERIGTKRVVVMGLLIVATGLFSYSIEPIMSSFVGGGAVRLMFGVGMGFIMAPATESIMGSLPKAKAGVGSAVNDTTRQAGGALGVAVIGSVFAATYHRVIEVPAGIARRRPLRWCTTRSARPSRPSPRSTSPPTLPPRCTTPPAMRSSAACRSRRGSGRSSSLGAAVIAFRYLPARADRAVRDDEDLANDAKELAVLDDGIYT